MQKTVLVAATVFLTGVGVCHAQPPGITREMISRALPLEGAPKAEPGPYQVISEPAFGSPGFHVYRPAVLDAFPGKDTLPVMVLGNGGCAIDSTHFSGFLTTIASHGILVIGTVPQEGAAPRQETADDMRAAIDWAGKENVRAGSPLNGKIAMDKIAVMGTSCGGFLSIALGADPRVKTIGVFNSGVQTPPAGQAQRAGGRGGPSAQPTADALPKLHGPVLLLNGGERRLPDGGVGGDIRSDQPCACVLRLAAQRRPQRDVLSSRRRRVRQRRLELAPVDAQRRQGSGQDVRRQGL